MSEDRPLYWTGQDPDEELKDLLVRLCHREGVPLAVVISSLLETSGMGSVGINALRRFWRKSLTWEQRLYQGDPAKYERFVLERLRGMLGG